MSVIRVGTRASALARTQTEWVIARWREREPALEVERIELTSTGDDQPDAPLERMEGTGFFTSTLERALLDGRIDVAVHSFKDLPVESTPGLAVAAVPERAPVEDVLCARAGATLADLAPGSRIGTSSLRRGAQLRALRPDLGFVPLRGNVPSRLRAVAEGRLDAVVLALAGLERLGLAGHVTEVFPVHRVLPAPAQGALAVQTRGGDAGLIGRLAALERAEVRRSVEAERAVLHALRGGCSVPVGAHASVRGGTLALNAGVFAPSGDRPLTVCLSGEDPAALGAEAARRLLEAGAGEILAALEREPRLAWERS